MFEKKGTFRWGGAFLFSTPKAGMGQDVGQSHYLVADLAPANDRHKSAVGDARTIDHLVKHLLHLRICRERHSLNAMKSFTRWRRGPDAARVGDRAGFHAYDINGTGALLKRD